jgi:hypothetical protein
MLTGRFVGVASEEALAKVDVVKHLVDTTEVLDTLNAWSRPQDLEVHSFGPAVAIAYLDFILSDTDIWRLSHPKCLASARSVLLSVANPGPGTKFGLQSGVACLTLAGMAGTSEERLVLLRKVAASASGEVAFLGLTATVDLCRESIKAGKFEEARQMAESGIKKYQTPAYWINMQILRKIQRQPEEGLDGYSWLSMGF